MNDSRPRYGGMTVNERLVVAGVMDQFDAAIRRRDRTAAIAVLTELDMSHASAASTVDATLSDPSKYGYT